MALKDLFARIRKPRVSELPPPGGAESDSFCVIPWKHLHYCDNGLVRFCCASHWMLDERSNPLTLYENTVEDLWNSEHMRRVRRVMVLGGDIPECEHCWKVEAVGGISRRMQENDSWNKGWVRMDGMSIEQLKADAIANDFYVEHRPFDIDVETTNTCNLKCRTCSSDRSSKIEQDPVHSRWQGRHFVPVRWKNNLATFGVTPVLGACYEGFLSHTKQMNAAARWTNGKGVITLPAFPDAVESLKVTFDPSMPDDHEVRVLVGESVAYVGRPHEDGLTQQIPAGETGGRIRLTFDSDRFKLSEEAPEVGVGIEKVEVRRLQPEAGGRRNNIMVSRFRDGKHWLKEDGFVYGELLSPAEEMRHIKLVGGEPLIMKETLNMIEFLAERGRPETFILSFTTNGTVFDQRFFEAASRFKKVVIVVSLDGVGELFEYIRHPAKWSAVVENLRRFAAIDNVMVRISTTFQAYNALAFTDLLRFCDQQGYQVLLNMLHHPDFLAPAVLPPSARRLAAQRLRDYLAEGKGIQNEQQVLSAVRMLESPGDETDEALLKRFMLFTNDLDKTRGETIGSVAPEIVEHVQQTGAAWIDETVFA